MSREYAENRIKEALKLTRGNPTKARQQIIAWTTEDHKLLQALTRPHLTGVVAHAINRVIHRMSVEEEMPEDSDVLVEKADTLDMDPNDFGAQIMHALEGRDTMHFGHESGTGRPLKKKPASQNHIDAIKRIAGDNKGEV